MKQPGFRVNHHQKISSTRNFYGHNDSRNISHSHQRIIPDNPRRTFMRKTNPFHPFLTSQDTALQQKNRFPNTIQSETRQRKYCGLTLFPLLLLVFLLLAICASIFGITIAVLLTNLGKSSTTSCKNDFLFLFSPSNFLFLYQLRLG